MTTPNKPSSAPEEDQAPEPAASTQEVAWLWLSREQLCQSENISQRTFFRRLKAGDFEKRRVGRRCIYRVRQGPAGAQQEPASELDDILHAGAGDDTVYGGEFLNNQPLVKEMTQWAPKVINLLERIGVPFNRSNEGNLAVRRFGGTLYKRTVYAGASTGQQLLYGLDEQVRQLGDGPIEIADLSKELQAPRLDSLDGGLKGCVEALEKQMLAAAMKRFDGNKTKVAEVLGLSRLGLRKKLARYGMGPEA